jgi:hypothetical protein
MKGICHLIEICTKNQLTSPLIWLASPWSWFPFCHLREAGQLPAELVKGGSEREREKDPMSAGNHHGLTTHKASNFSLIMSFKVCIFSLVDLAHMAMDSFRDWRV